MVTEIMVDLKSLIYVLLLQKGLTSSKVAPSSLEFVGHQAANDVSF